MKHLLYLFLIANLLVACGGGSEDSDREYRPAPAPELEADTAPEIKYGYVSTFITDNLSQEYSEVWVLLKEIYVDDASGNKIELYSNPQGFSVNLSELVSVSQFMAGVKLAEGTYSNFTVELASSIKLVDNANQTINAVLSADDNDVQVNVTGELTVTADAMSTLTLDFDLAQFTYDVDTNTVSPVVQVLDNNESRTQEAELHGTVTRVDANSFAITSDRLSQEVSISVSAHTDLYDEDSNSSDNDISLISEGDVVKVRGIYDVEAAEVDANRVHIEKDDVDSSDNDSYYEIEGTVVSFDGSTLEVDIRQASFVPESDTLIIANVTNANYQTGALDQLANGQWVEIKGQWDGTTFTANYIYIEGALNRSEQDDQVYTDQYVEVEGIVASVDGSNVVVNVSRSEHSSIITVNSMITLDVSNAWYEDGNTSCLIVGSYIEAKGALTDSVMAAKKVEFKGDCGSFEDYQYVDNEQDDSGVNDDSGSDDSAYDNDDSSGSDDSANDNDDSSGSDDSAYDNDDSSNSDDDSNYRDDDNDGFDDNYDNEYDEVKGIITAVSANSITLKVSKTEGFSVSTSTITIDITNSYYEDGTSSNLLVNTFIEVKGYWDGVTFTARKIEFD